MTSNEDGPLPSVSVVISNYNYGKYLRQCIDSALAQTHPCEVVVVDDGSTDDSLAVLDSYGDAITVIRQRNLGQGGAINSGVLATHGDIVCMQDADDWLTADRSAVVAAAFVANSTVEWLLHNMSVVDEDGALVSKYMQKFNVSDRMLDDIIDFGDTAGNGGGLCFRRTFFDKIGPVPEGAFLTGADAYLILSAIFYGDPLVINEPLAMRREHGGSASSWSRPQARLSLSWIDNRWILGSRAAELAAGAGPRAGMDAVASRRTWWQAKADLQNRKIRPDKTSRELLRLWRRLVVAIARSRMSEFKKLVFIVRDSALLVLPHKSYLSGWWMLHYGRPRVGQALSGIKATIGRTRKPGSRFGDRA